MYKFAKRYDGVNGSAIRAIFSLLGDPEIISFAGGNPSPLTFEGEYVGDVAKKLLSEKGDTLLQYGNTLGYDPLRETIACVNLAEGVRCSRDNVIITTGSSQAIDLTTKAFCNEGDVVLCEGPTFLGALQTFVLYSAKPVSVEMDEKGIIPDDLKRKIAEYKPKLLYTIPTFQNPTGRTLADDRRLDIVEICSKAGVVIIEDDPYGALRFTGEKLLPLKHYDYDDMVVRLISYSKTVSPGIRVGAAVAHPDIIHKLNLGKQGQDVHTPLLNQAIVNEYITSGRLAPHIEDNIRLYRQQMSVMYAAIEREFPKEAHVLRAEGGMFLWCELPESIDALELFTEAVKRKVAFVPGTHFYAEGGHKNTMRLNFSMESEERIDRGITTLGKLIKEYI